MKKALGLLLLGVLAATFVTEVPSGHAIMGIRAARTAIAARRAAKKVKESTGSDEANKEDLRTAEKIGQDRDATGGDRGSRL